MGCDLRISYGADLDPGTLVPWKPTFSPRRLAGLGSVVAHHRLALLCGDSPQVSFWVRRLSSRNVPKPGDTDSIGVNWCERISSPGCGLLSCESSTEPTGAAKTVWFMPNFRYRTGEVADESLIADLNALAERSSPAA